VILLESTTAMPYTLDMEIIETRPFDRRRDELFGREQFQELQKHLVLDPLAGHVIPGGAGLRKIRWAGSGRGKRGGIRVIYFYRSWTNRLFLLVAYRKNECEDLTKSQIKDMARIIDKL